MSASAWLEVVGWGGSALVVFSLLQTRVLRFRVLNFIACAVLLAYNAALSVWPMVGMNAVLCAINAYFFVTLVRSRHSDTSFVVLPVRPDDAYLSHVLRVHAADIAEFQPTMTWEPASPEAHAYLVQRGDETVGVVLLHADGPVARVALDYVTPRFRDFSPGEFVWRQSEVMKESGFTTIIAPAGMVDPYYERVGFVRGPEGFRLTLTAN